VVPTQQQALADTQDLQLSLTDTQISALLAFAGMLEKWNKHFNLLSRRDIERIWSRHILDSLSIAALLHGRKILDLGSGGGFPGLPLAIVAPEREFLLVDRHQRKCRFLEQVATTLELANVRVHCGDVAELIPAPVSSRSTPAQGSAGGSYDTITSRAVAPAAAIWRLAQPLLAAGEKRVDQDSKEIAEQAGGRLAGRLIVMAGTRNSSAQLPEGARCERLSIPGLEQDHEVVIIDASITDG